MLTRRYFLRLLPLFGASALVSPPGRREGPPAGSRVGRAGPAAAVEPAASAAEEPPGEEADSYSADDDRFRKTRDFDRHYHDDVFLEASRLGILRSVASRMERVRSLVGFGNFNLLGWNRMLKLARDYPQIGAFPRHEIDFLEEIFYADARRYGFRGEKVLTAIDAEIPERSVRKIAGTGHYLLWGEPLRKYEQIRRDLGRSVILTSGVRSVGKQFQLFLSKAVKTAGNLSQASRSLAPPGYSYHSIGDFDVGKSGFGLGNFSEAFCETDEYRRLIDLGYVAIRYTPDNPFGVRHEPWHIKAA